MSAIYESPGVSLNAVLRSLGNAQRVTEAIKADAAEMDQINAEARARLLGGGKVKPMAVAKPRALPVSTLPPLSEKPGAYVPRWVWVSRGTAPTMACAAVPESPVRALVSVEMQVLQDLVADVLDDWWRCVGSKYGFRAQAIKYCELTSNAWEWAIEHAKECTTETAAKIKAGMARFYTEGGYVRGKHYTITKGGEA